MSIIDELHKVFDELPPPPRWNGDVRKTRYLPYDAPDPKTGEMRTVHAVLVNRTLHVSKEAWEALSIMTDEVILGRRLPPL